MILTAIYRNEYVSAIIYIYAVSERLGNLLIVSKLLSTNPVHLNPSPYETEANVLLKTLSPFASTIFHSLHSGAEDGDTIKITIQCGALKV